MTFSTKASCLRRMNETARPGRCSQPRSETASVGEAVPVLIAFLDDDVTVGHAVKALGKLRAKESRPKLEALTSHTRHGCEARQKKRSPSCRRESARFRGMRRL